MDFKHLEAFIKVVELASFSKAAEALYISQPSVSTYITSLEKELGVLLINRWGKSLQPTAAGSLFLEKAKELLSLKESTFQMLHALSHDVRGNIHILASSVPSQFILPPLLARFRKEYPHITFSVSEGDTAQVIKGISTHQGDIGFAGSTLGSQQCVFHPFIREELVFIAPEDGGYFPDKIYTLKELLYIHPFIAREVGSGTRMQYEHFFVEQGISLSKISTGAVMSSTQGILNGVANGLGISMVSRLSLKDPYRQKNILPLRLNVPLPGRDLYMVSNKQPSRITQVFMDYFLSSH